jgi:hypothetical protein
MIQNPHHASKIADPGKNQFGSGRYVVNIRDDFYARAQTLYGIDDAPDVACAIIQQCYHS